MASKQRQAFRMCVLPCPHSLCCLFGRGACTVSTRECFLADTPIPHGILSQEDAQARIPRGSGSAAAKAQRRLQSWGSRMDL